MMQRLGLVALLLASPVQASNAKAYVAQITANCSPVATAQLRNCSVSHLYSCEDGRHISIGLINGEYVSANLMSADFAPISWSGLDGFGHSVVTTAQEWFSLDKLRADGRSTQRARVALDVQYFKGEVDETVDAVLDGQSFEFKGQTILTGQVTQKLMMPSPYGTFETRYYLYVAQDAPLMATSLHTMVSAGQTETFEAGLMDVIRPDEAGFLDNRGQHDCDTNGVNQ